MVVPSMSNPSMTASLPLLTPAHLSLSTAVRHACIYFVCLILAWKTVNELSVSAFRLISIVVLHVRVSVCVLRNCTE